MPYVPTNTLFIADKISFLLSCSELTAWEISFIASIERANKAFGLTPKQVAKLDQVYEKYSSAPEEEPRWKNQLLRTATDEWIYFELDEMLRLQAKYKANIMLVLQVAGFTSLVNEALGRGLTTLEELEKAFNVMRQTEKTSRHALNYQVSVEQRDRIRNVEIYMGSPFLNSLKRLNRQE